MIACFSLSTVTCLPSRPACTTPTSLRISLWVVICNRVYCANRSKSWSRVYWRLHLSVRSPKVFTQASMSCIHPVEVVKAKISQPIPRQCKYCPCYKTIVLARKKLRRNCHPQLGLLQMANGFTIRKEHQRWLKLRILIQKIQAHRQPRNRPPKIGTMTLGTSLSAKMDWTKIIQVGTAAEANRSVSTRGHYFWRRRLWNARKISEKLEPSLYSKIVKCPIVNEPTTQI